MWCLKQGMLLSSAAPITPGAIVQIRCAECCTYSSTAVLIPSSLLCLSCPTNSHLTGRGNVPARAYTLALGNRSRAHAVVNADRYSTQQILCATLPVNC